MTKVVHCRKDKYDVLIDRTTKWGNPFKIGKDGTREEVVAKYETWIRKHPKLLSCLSELEGKILGCWCKPEACHGDVLIKLIEERKTI
jgi:hypothetical protein